MYCVIPSDLLAGGLELVCCGFTLVAAVVGYVLSAR
ncbi:hypothetical protein Psta_2072 [Pirellula staleyi DSM 6068]|uniref:Uncharacterized protein n=1 Tax=Pirellula staleyi (strain ATCC 27377 / DSM 6068 / ICPB 4128) TaxID=530564 RepID=D2R1M7_PIRSD|nr:hypothetical protein Psta_2072 [Pirellula staleyi DSM 6068]